LGIDFILIVLQSQTDSRKPSTAAPLSKVIIHRNFWRSSQESSAPITGQGEYSLTKIINACRKYGLKSSAEACIKK
jgi:hypothetical protein